VNHLHAAIIIAVLVSLLIVSEADALDSIEIRSAVGGTINGWSNLVDNTFTWNPQNFAGFFYDIKNDLGTETLKFVLTENNRLSGDNPYGITSPDTIGALMNCPGPTYSTRSPPTRIRYPTSSLSRFSWMTIVR
jgi:hypothetical protein